MKISLIVAMDEAGGIGKNNHLLCHLAADLRHFKLLTIGKPILMGRRTFESIGRALPQRRNLVLTHQSLTLPNIEVVKTLEEAWVLLHNSPEVMIIGGAQLYTKTLSIAQCIYLTRIHHTFKADVFFPTIPLTVWKETYIAHHTADQKNDYAMTFYRLDRKNIYTTSG